MADEPKEPIEPEPPQGVSDVMEQTAQFCEELDKLLLRFATEYELPYVSLVGALQMTVTRLTLDAIALEEMEEEGEDATD